MKAVHARTPGLMCDACTGKVKAAVKDLPGVISVTAQFSRGITSVLFDENAVATSAIIDAITAAGFTVEPA